MTFEHLFHHQCLCVVIAGETQSERTVCVNGNIPRIWRQYTEPRTWRSRSYEAGSWWLKRRRTRMRWVRHCRQCTPLHERTPFDEVLVKVDHILKHPEIRRKMLNKIGRAGPWVTALQSSLTNDPTNCQADAILWHLLWLLSETCCITYFVLSFSNFIEEGSHCFCLDVIR